MAITPLHAVLVDLKWDENSRTAPSALDLLSYLLQMSAISEETLRAGHAVLQSRRGRTRAPPNHVYDVGTNKADAVLSLAAQPRPSVYAQPPQSDASLNSKAPEARRRHIALRIYYDGGAYTGLAENVGQANDASIERALFAALHTARLIPSSVRQRTASSMNEMNEDNETDNVSYSRCGRTDKGVSAAGQVVALYLKSAFPLQAYEHNPSEHSDPAHALENEQLPSNALDKLSLWVPAKTKKPSKNDNAVQSSENPTAWVHKDLSEYAYDKILNNLLPPDIRVLGWCPVSTDFSARFSCTRRAYRYFFVQRPSLNLDTMKEGLQRLVGAHDFRNFCKMDVEKVYNFHRHVHSADIVTVDEHTSYILIVGQAFLWHQIRCIAHVLFLIGRGLESPSIVTELLNVAQHPGKPSYPLANERPLVLHDCQYANLTVGYAVSNLWNLQCLQEQQWEDFTLAAARVRSCMQSLLGVTISKRDLVAFRADKLKQRAKKSGKQAIMPLSGLSGTTPDCPLAETMTWYEALSWLKLSGLFPEPDKSTDFVYTPLLERSKGTTYEEKISALQNSTKRRQKYEDNVVKKRKSQEEDAAFYDHMTKQGGHAG